MGRRVTIPEAVTITGLSEYFIRKGIKEGRFPHLRTGIGSGKIIIDIELLERYLTQEAEDNAHMGATQPPVVIEYGKLRQVKG